ncbi:SDR family oxidoreductase [Vibrio neptunius]|uniref:SDR family oxidoreductase n=1 Tax=Vibrio neptunius TaxID=170651 RepID=A0ABS3A9W5_9VIBR|nr:SDR family oxidoreductase [Vibrio neptunius]MBN3495718.1 SDR family oxidoreductase [Vibrio neptunius]MBN3518190.1 SDR family oxidoreductase [Vibrio neptunius]MBN3552492.1 SDR family oxidoreductase [Vibrio neptunius]MBN3580602.1 SDR family oxidoreductase [Vibrio neptunius]MCH9874268.1 SDR family oxidoreductase [Vibrio neptunius]
MNTIAVIGATGYLGTFVCKVLEERGFQTRYLVRSKTKLIEAGVSDKSIRQVNVTSPDSLKGQLEGVDCVISCLGITRQKDGLSYMDVDYQANINVLDEAQKAGVKKFIYVSVFRGNEFRDVALCDAKERFVDYLKKSQMQHCVIRPTGFFSDMQDFLDMARTGRVYLFGSGSQKLNPIHGEDLANFIVDAVKKDESNLNVGGPQVFSHVEIAELAFSSLHQKNKTTHLPDAVRKLALWIGKRFLSESKFGPVEFFLTVLGNDMVAPGFGHQTLESHFNRITKGTEGDKS